MPVIELTDDGFLVRVRAPAFTDAEIRDGYFGPERTDAGTIRVEPWSEWRRVEYRRRLRLHQRIGRRFKRLHDWLDTPGHNHFLDNTPGSIVVDGEYAEETRMTRRLRLADWLNARLQVRPPADRSKLIQGVTITGASTAIRFGRGE